MLQQAVQPGGGIGGLVDQSHQPERAVRQAARRRGAAGTAGGGAAARREAAQRAGLQPGEQAEHLTFDGADVVPDQCQQRTLHPAGDAVAGEMVEQGLHHRAERGGGDGGGHGGDTNCIRVSMSSEYLVSCPVQADVVHNAFLRHGRPTRNPGRHPNPLRHVLTCRFDPVAKIGVMKPLQLDQGQSQRKTCCAPTSVARMHEDNTDLAQTAKFC